MAVEDGKTTPAVHDGTLIHVCRSAWLSPAEYALYRAILLAFPERGRAPNAAELELLAQRYGIDAEETLRRFARQDLVQRDATTGEIAVAYPFSAVPTIHRIRFEHDTDADSAPECPDLYAMCAIDALGVPLMLSRAAWIE